MAPRRALRGFGTEDTCSGFGEREERGSGIGSQGAADSPQTPPVAMTNSANETTANSTPTPFLMTFVSSREAT
jgi:hypothetical protein